jgi:WhiB family transcriptional regulator, redox-sensing transcriptional regulator
MLLPERPAWMQDAACHGRGDLFFGPRNERPPSRHRRERAAKEVCSACPAMSECRDYARENRERGVWGGETDEERSIWLRFHTSRAVYG